MSAFAKFYFRPSKGEKIHTVVTPKEDESSGIYGKVTDGERQLRRRLSCFLKQTDRKRENFSRRL